MTKETYISKMVAQLIINAIANAPKRYSFTVHFSEMAGELACNALTIAVLIRAGFSPLPDGSATWVSGTHMRKPLASIFPLDTMVDCLDILDPIEVMAA